MLNMTPATQKTVTGDGDSIMIGYKRGIHSRSQSMDGILRISSTTTHNTIKIFRESREISARKGKGWKKTCW